MKVVARGKWVNPRLTLAVNSEHQLSLVYVFDELVGGPVVAMGTDCPVQLQRVGVEPTERKR